MTTEKEDTLSNSDLRHSYLDSDDSLLSTDMQLSEKIRLDSLMQLSINTGGQLFDSDSSRSEIEAMFDEAEKRAAALIKSLSAKINQVLHEDDTALADVGIRIVDPDHHHNLSLETFCSLYRGLYEIVELTVQHLVCVPSDLVESFDEERVVITKALILDKCREYFRLVHISSYSFISCCHECPIIFNHAKVVKFIELLLQPIEDVKFIVKCLNTLARYVGQVLDQQVPEHQQLMQITSTYSSLDVELEELTGFPDFIPLHLNLQIKFDEIRHKEAHQIKCLQTVKLHLDQLRLFSSTQSESQPFVLPEVLSISIYQDFLLHPHIVDMVFGNCLDIIEVHEQFLESLDQGFLNYVDQIPDLTAEYCTLISEHYEKYRDMYGALIGEVVFTSELIELLTSKCPEFAYFLKMMSEKSQKTLTPHRGKYSFTGVFQNIARHIMSYSNFFAVIEDLCKQKSSQDWELVLEKVNNSQAKIKSTIKYLNDVTESRCLAHACLGTIGELPLCVLFSRGQTLRLPPAVIKFGFSSKPKDECVLYFFSGLIEIAQKRRPYSLLSGKDHTKTQMHCYHLHLQSLKYWKVTKESSNLVKVTPAVGALCTLNTPQNVLKGLHYKNCDQPNATSINGSKNHSNLFLKFSETAVLEIFLAQFK